MAINKSAPMRFTPKGLSDAYDSTDTFPGACKLLTNLVFDQSNPELVVARPGVYPITQFANYPNPGVVSVFAVIGQFVYGLIASTLFAGSDVPFIFDLTTLTFKSIGGAGAFPATQPTSGAWTPPTIASVGTLIIVTHPGFANTASKFGWFDVSNPAAPTWNSGDTTTNGLGAVPVAVANYNNRAWFAVGNQVKYTDVLTLTRTNASQALTLGDNSAITALNGLPIQTTSSGIAAALLAFKATQTWQITGDTTFPAGLSQNFLSLTIGTLAPRTIVNTAFGCYFVAPTGPYMVDQSGAIRPIVHDGQSTSPDIVAPFINCTQPSRACAAYTGSIYRVCLDSNVDGTVSRADYWFDEHVRRWNGPHTFTYDCASGVGNPIDPFGAPAPGMFLLASNANPAGLFYSRVVTTLAGVQTDNGAAIKCTLQSSSFPKTGRMAMKQVAESTIELSARVNAVSFVVTAQTETGNTLGAVTMTVTPTGGIWGAFNWGSGVLWASSYPPPQTYGVPWAAPLVFEKMQLRIEATSSGSLAIGTFYARYQETGYQTTNLPTVSSATSGSVPSSPYGNVLTPGVIGALAWYVTASSVGPATAAQATAYLNLFTTTLKGLVPPPGAANGFFLRDDGTWQPAGGGGGGGSGIVAAGTAGQLAYYAVNGTTVSGRDQLLASMMPALTGDVTSAGGTLTTTVPTNQLTLDKLVQIYSGSPGVGGLRGSLLGNVDRTGGFGNVQSVAIETIAPSVASAISVFTALVNGFAPKTGGAVGNFLRDDATWQPVPGVGSATKFTFLSNLTNATASPVNNPLGTLPVSSYSAGVTLDYINDTLVFLNANAGSFVVTLPAANAAGVGISKQIILKRTDGNAANAITVNRAGADLIEGATSLSLLPQTSIVLASDGSSNWWIV